MPKMDPRDITDWLKENCGTIHTFQGKEANEVLLVLGCDTQTGKAAAEWVGKKPNIINVAVSRAKYRLGVIGEYELWEKIEHVRTACKYLKRQTFMPLTRRQQKDENSYFQDRLSTIWMKLKLSTMIVR